MFLYNLCKRKEEKTPHFAYYHAEDDDQAAKVTGKQSDMPSGSNTEHENNSESEQQNSND